MVMGGEGDLDPGLAGGGEVCCPEAPVVEVGREASPRRDTGEGAERGE